MANPLIAPFLWGDLFKAKWCNGSTTHFGCVSLGSSPSFVTKSTNAKSMGLSTQVWGKEGWRFIHSVALSYPLQPTKEDKEHYLTFLKSLQYVLPCPICAENFKKKIEKTPPNLENRKTFFNWTVDAHNEVNKENGKKIFTYDEAFDSIYEQIKEEQERYNVKMKRLMIIEDVKTILPYMALSVFFSYVITRKTK